MPREEVDRFETREQFEAYLAEKQAEAKRPPQRSLFSSKSHLLYCAVVIGAFCAFHYVNSDAVRRTAVLRWVITAFGGDPEEFPLTKTPKELKLPENKRPR